MNIKKIISMLLAISVICLAALISLASCEDKGDDKKGDGESDGKSGDGDGESKDEGPQPKSFLKEAATGERNDYTGSVGYEFECLADMTVSAVGRPQNGAMNNSHTIRIWDVETQSLLGSADVTPDSPLDSLGFKTAQLGSPIKLKAGVSYRIVSAEEKDGDMWYDIGAKTEESVDLKPNDECRMITPAFSGEPVDDYPANQYQPEGSPEGPINRGYTGVTFYYIVD